MRVRSISIAALLLASGAIIPACSGGKSVSGIFIPAAVTIAAANSLMPRGPDAIGGAGDFLLSNAFVRAVVDAPGADPGSEGGAFPLSNGSAPSGGNLIDVSDASGLNDQWTQMVQGVVGTILRVDGTSGAADAAGVSFDDAAVDFAGAGVSSGDTLHITSGANAGRAYRIGNVAGSLSLFVPPGVPYQTDASGTIAYRILHQTSPLDNSVAYTAATIVSAGGDSAVLRVSGVVLNRGEVPDGCAVQALTRRLLAGPGGPEIAVETDYVLSPSSRALGVETRVSNPAGAAVSIIAVADVVQSGGTLPWSPLRGFDVQGLSFPEAAPFLTLRGRDEPGASYTIVDVGAGQLVFASDGGSTSIAQQRPRSVEIPASGALAWSRQLTVGGRNDVASSADEAIRLLGTATERTDPDTGGTIPNGVRGVATLTGQVLGATPGTRVTASQVSPALVFDPGPPLGRAPAPGFVSSAVLGLAELPVSEASLDAQGRFSLSVPFAFAGRSPTATLPPASDLSFPPGLENGTTFASYRLVVEAPGHEPQGLTVHTGSITPVHFDLRGGSGTIDLVVSDELGNPIPARVLIVGMDPDGAGPTPVTPDPELGGREPRAAGDGTTVHLLDGRGQVQVPPGAYQVLASRGLEYTVDRFPAPGAATPFFLVAAGQTVRTESSGVPLRLHRLLDSAALPDPVSGTFESPLRRHVAADFHVHAGASWNSAVPLQDRVLSNLATGVEVLVTSDHDNLSDLGPALAELDERTDLPLSQMMATAVGVEASGSVPVDVPGLVFPNGNGHHSAWPLTRTPAERRNGAPEDEFRSPALLYEQLRARGAGVVQLNHPRFPVVEPPLAPVGLGFFSNGKAGFGQPDTGIDAFLSGGYASPLRSSITALVASNDGSLDDLNLARTPGGTRYNSFDAIEVYGGNTLIYGKIREDWLALLSAGYVRTATASPDLHSLRDAAGFPRTYVAAPGNASADLSAVDLAQLNATLLPSLVPQGAPGTTAPLSGQFFPAIRRPGAGADAMEVLCTSGPVVFVEVSGDETTFSAQPGDLVTDGGTLGSVDVRVTVLAAPWVPVSEATIIVNGGNLAPSSLSGIGGSTTSLNADLSPQPADPFSTNPADLVRLRKTYTVVLPAGAGQDNWLKVEARGVATPGSVYDRLVPGLQTAVGFTNPVFIDRNGDGDWDPNGVP